MRAFITPINSLLSHDPDIHPDSLRKISALAGFCVITWRAVTLMLFMNPDALSVPISSVVKSVGLRLITVRLLTQLTLLG